MRKQNRPGISGIQRKHIAAAVTAAVFLLLVFALLLHGRSSLKNSTAVKEEDSISYSLRFRGEDYEGTYEGSTVGGKPEGSGVFTDKDGKFTYSGEWENGKFHGFGSIQYGDGTREEGMYHDGSRHHWVRRYESDTHYKDGVYDFGNLYGCMSEYKDGELVHETLIANGDHVSQIKKEAVKLTRSLIEDRGYINQYVYITGKVVYLQESEATCYFRIETDSVGMVMGNYTNTVGYRSAQPMVQNMELNETVTVYGYYTGIIRDELEADKDFYEYSCIQIDPVFSEPASGDKDRGTYESISRNPYSYCGKVMTGDYVVDHFMKSGDIFFLYAHTAGQKDEKYVLRVETDPGAVFYGEQTLNLKGYIAGQRKTEDWRSTYVDSDGNEMEIVGYDKKPVIKVISFEAR